jgi:drug/metabolite transporter (DMT)-like permease
VKARDLLDLVLLASLWGASFLFMRMGAHEFGPTALAFVRVLVASIALVPLLLWHGLATELRTGWPRVFAMGAINSALPFWLYSFASLSITAGLASVFNAATPLFGAVIAWIWLKDKPGVSRWLGIAIGFAGVTYLAWDKASFKPGASSTGWAVLACVVATVLYGFGASFAKRYLQGLAPLTVATGSQIGASLVLLVPAWLMWPTTPPSASSWLAVALLGAFCTGIAYILYFRLIRHIGAAKATTVTFLIPLFAVLWGGLFLGEAVSMVMAIGCAIILVGTALASGLVSLPTATRQAAKG